MKFFKHFTDAHEGRSMLALMNKFGLEGYAAYFILAEICGKKLEKEAEETYTEDHLKFTFNERIVREKLRMRSTKVELFLNYCATLDLLQFTKVEDEITFYFPKLLESMDRDSKRARTERADGAPKNKIKKEKKNKEEEIDKDKEIRAQIEIIYQLHYPLKKGKSDGIAAAAKQIKTEQDLVDFETAVTRYSIDCERKGTDPKYIKHFSTFVSTWRDWLDPDAGKATITPIRQTKEQQTFDHTADQARRVMAGEL